MKHNRRKLCVSMIAVCVAISNFFCVPSVVWGVDKGSEPIQPEQTMTGSEAGSSMTGQHLAGFEAGLSVFERYMAAAEAEPLQPEPYMTDDVIGSLQSEPYITDYGIESLQPEPYISEYEIGPSVPEPPAIEASEAALSALSAQEQTAFSESVNIDGVIVSVRAEDGVFPEGAALSVEKLPLRAQIFVEEAVEKERTEGISVAAAYTFDISVVDADGNELQPADGFDVEVSFGLDEVADQNLDTAVFHVKEEDGELNAAALDVTVSDNTAVVMTEGFSFYTVEFTYLNRQYVMHGGTEMPLRDILDEIELYGEVASVEVSDSELFEAYQVYGEWFVRSYVPFLTEEWMRVTIAGIEYEIKVTDALPAYGAPGTVYVSQVTQGTDGKTFAADAPLSSIQINNDILLDLSKAEYRKITSDPGLITLPGSELYYLENDKGATADITGIFAAYDTNQEGAHKPTLSKTEDNLIPGDLFAFTYKDAAILEDGSFGDVVLTYSNLHITLQNNTNIYTGTYYIASGNMLRVGNTNPSTYINNSGKTSYYNNRNGIQVDVNIHVLDKEGNLVPGTFAFPMTDIDVARSGNSFNSIYNASNNNSYSEQIAVKSGYVGGIYIPDYEGIDEVDALNAINIDPENPPPSPKTKWDYWTESNRGYKTGIEVYQYEEDGEQKEAVRFVGIGKSDDDPGTYYSGFYTIADNTSGGINLTAWQAGSRSAPVRTNLLNGKQVIQHKINSTTTHGGTIQTTINGNSPGDLTDGSSVIGPATVVVSDGKTVKYTMTPDPRYFCEEIFVGDSIDGSDNSIVIPRSELEKLINGEISEIDITLNEGGYTETIGDLTNEVEEKEGKLTYNPENGTFIFEFSENNYDHKISVTWGWTPVYDLQVEKMVMGNQSSVYQYFPFTIRIEIPSGADIRRCELDASFTNYDLDNDDVKASIYYKPTDIVDQPMSISDFIPEPGEAKEVTVWLRHGQGLKILNLPEGTTYSVTENPGDYTETVVSRSMSWKNTDYPGSSSDSYGTVMNAGHFSRELIQICEPAPSGTIGRYIKSGTKTCYQVVDESYSGIRYDYDVITGEYRESADGSGIYGKVEIDTFEEIDPLAYSGGEQTYIQTSSYWLYEKSHTITHINEKDAPVPTSVSLGLMPAISCLALGCGGMGAALLGRRRDEDE